MCDYQPRLCGVEETRLVAACPALSWECWWPYTRMDTVEAPPKRRGIPNWLVPAIGYSVSAASLTWVFWKFPYAQLADHLRTLEWNWVALAILLEVAVYFFDAWRWGVLLRPVGAPDRKSVV